MIFCRLRTHRPFRVAAIVSLFITAAVIIHNRMGISSNIRSAHEGVSTELHSVQVWGEQPLSTSSKTNPRFERLVIRQPRLPNVILVGVNKGGTRALITYLDLHPEVVTAISEVDYFGLHYGRGEEWYKNQMPPSMPGQLTMEKSPKYYETAEAPQRIHAMNESMKILLVVRDPVDRSVSHWQHSCRNVRKLGFDAAFCQAYESSGVLKNDGDVDPNCEYINRSSYAKFIENWTRFFPLRTQLHVVDGQKLVSDPVSELRKVETFLGLRHYFTQKNFQFNNKTGFYCLPSDGGHIRCLGKSKGVKHPTLDPLVEAKLRKYFKPSNQRFYRIVGHDFGWR